MKTLIDYVWHFDADEIAERTGHHRKTIMEWCRTGKLKGVKVWRDWYVSEVELRRYFPRWELVKTSRPRPGLLTCYHEAGHAVCAFHLRVGFEYVTATPHDDSLGHMKYLEQWDWDDVISLDELVQHLVIVLAGPMAEARHNKKAYEPTGSDRDTLVDILLGHEPSFEARFALFNYIERKTEGLVNTLWDDIERVAKALTERTTLTRDEVAAMMEDA